MGKRKRKRGHGPSEYRALVREAKKGEDGAHPSKLLKEARRLKDPYYVSLAVFEISGNGRLGTGEAMAAAEGSMDLVDGVDRSWRRAELLTTIARKIGRWRTGGEAREKLFDLLMDKVRSLPTGTALSDAIAGCASRVSADHVLDLLGLALGNKGSEVKDGKAVIRSWAYGFPEGGPSMEDLLGVLKDVKDAGMRSRLLGYLHLQCRKTDRVPGPSDILQAAIGSALDADGEDRLGCLRYLAMQAMDGQELEAVAGALERMEDRVERARLYATLGGIADKSGSRDKALAWFKEGARLVSGIKAPSDRASIGMNLAQGLSRSGEKELAKGLFEAALKDSDGNPGLRDRIIRTMEELGFDVPEGVERTRTVRKVRPVEEREGPRDVLGLYDAYEGGLKPTHLRAVARAAPLCMAYGLDLALMGFPSQDLGTIVEQAITETNIGRGGRYLSELVKQGRVGLVHCKEHEPPKDMDDLGLLVATTSRPKDDKRVTMDDIIDLARKEHPRGRICVVMGLGRRGLPRSLLERARYHLELTGSDVPLETATVMGVIAEQLRASRDR